MSHLSTYNYRVLSVGDGEAVHAFAMNALRARGGDDLDVVFHSWSARWRQEALEHYLKLGWSMLAREGEHDVGFFLAQPLLFFRGQAQSLWIEHLEARDNVVRAALIDVAIKMAREKHLQRVLCEAGPEVSESLPLFGPSATLLDERWIEVKTTTG